MQKIKRNITKVTLLATLLSVATCSTALMIFADKQVYKTVNKDGTITYSDKPSQTAEEVVLDVPLSTFQSISPILVQPPKGNNIQQVQYSLTILSPAADATVRNNLGELSIGASIEPRVAGFFQLHINDQVHESATGMFKLTEMDRGAYTYSVKFINNSGKVIASSETRNVFLHQASALIN